jgi:hypothetical protein
VRRVKRSRKNWNARKRNATKRVAAMQQLLDEALAATSFADRLQDALSRAVSAEKELERQAKLPKQSCRDTGRGYAAPRCSFFASLSRSAVTR